MSSASLRCFLIASPIGESFSAGGVVFSVEARGGGLVGCFAPWGRGGMSGGVSSATGGVGGAVGCSLLNLEGSLDMRSACTFAALEGGGGGLGAFSAEEGPEGALGCSVLNLEGSLAINLACTASRLLSSSTFKPCEGNGNREVLPTVKGVGSAVGACNLFSASFALLIL